MGDAVGTAGAGGAGRCLVAGLAGVGAGLNVPLDHENVVNDTAKFSLN